MTVSYYKTSASTPDYTFEDVVCISALDNKNVNTTIIDDENKMITRSEEVAHGIKISFD